LVTHAPRFRLDARPERRGNDSERALRCVFCLLCRAGISQIGGSDWFVSASCATEPVSACSLRNSGRAAPTWSDWHKRF